MAYPRSCWCFLKEKGTAVGQWDRLFIGPFLGRPRTVAAKAPLCPTHCHHTGILPPLGTSGNGQPVADRAKYLVGVRPAARDAGDQAMQNAQAPFLCLWAEMRMPAFFSAP